MVKVIVRIIVKDMVRSSSISSISSTIIRSNCLSLSHFVPGDTVGDIEDSLGTDIRNSRVAVGDSYNAPGTDLWDTGNSAGGTCQCKTGTTNC